MGREALLGGSWGNGSLWQHSSSQPRLLQVPSIVRCIYRWLTSNTDASAEHRLDNTLLELTHAHPHDVVVTLLRCAPSCDRYGAHLP